MLSNKEIHYIISTELQTLGANYYNDFEKEEIDTVINGVLFNLETVIKDKKANGTHLSSLEKEFFNASLSSLCSKPTYKDGTYEIDLESVNVQNANFRIYDKNCKSSKTATSIDDKQVYIANTDTLYNDTWYKKCDIIVGNETKDYYGDVSKISSTVKNGQVLGFNEFNSFLKNSFDTIVYSIIGNKLKAISKYPIIEICYDFIKDSSLNKMDSCNNITLNYNENIQRYIINLAVEKLAIITEQNPNKINLLNNIKQIT